MNKSSFVSSCLCVSALCFCLLLSACDPGIGAPPPPVLTVVTPPATPVNYTVRNADWQSVIQAFDGVEMVLVPAGCFNMGINEGDTGDSDELPLSTQCFQSSFWIDRTEVTNQQFARFKGVAKLNSTWADPQRPRTNIRWKEARDFCALRGARLPTEREWEYAARGPDALIYPWGNDWNPDVLVQRANANAQTADVGSYPLGASWVGALDLAGNIWEWTTTLYDKFAYPYTLNDGRDNPDDLTDERVIRGASWYEADPYYARASNRGRLGANIQDFNVGLRCAHDY